jgi:hypothetical protein
MRAGAGDEDRADLITANLDVKEQKSSAACVCVSVHGSLLT